MTSSGRPKLGDVFRGEKPDRIEGLAGLLPAGQPGRPVRSRPVAVPVLREVEVEDGAARDRTSNEFEAAPANGSTRGSALREEGPTAPEAKSAPEDETGVQSSTEVAGARRPRKANPADRSAPATRPHGERAKAVRDNTVKMVPANIDVTVHQELRKFAVRTELPFATIALRAIEANAEELARLWRTPPIEPLRTGLFASVQDRPANRRIEPAAQVQLRLRTSDAAVLDGLVTDWSAPSRSALVNEALRRYLTASGMSTT